MNGNHEAGSPRPALEARSLTIRYGERAVLSGAGLEVGPGEVHALLGRNGSGKTSLVRCLLGQQVPSAGRVLLFGEDVARRRAQLMVRVGVTSEEPNAPAAWSTRVLAAYCRPLYPLWRDRLFFDRIAHWGIDPARPFGQLSRGQKSLVQLALALASEPELLILDDPTLGLDAVARQTVIRELIGELAERPMAVLLTSHDFAGIESLATHVSLLHGGRLQLQEEVETLRSRFRLLRFQLPDGCEAAPLLAALKPLEVRSFGRAIEALVGCWDEEEGRKLAVRCGERSFAASQPSLENIFIAMTTGELS